MTLRIELLEPFAQYPALYGVPGAMDTAWSAFGNSGIFTLITGFDGQGRALKSTKTGAITGEALTYAFRTGSDQKMTFHFGFLLYELGGSLSNGAFADILDELGNVQFSLRINALGKMDLMGEGGLVVATTTQVFTTNQAYRCCLQVDMSAANSTIVKMSVNARGTLDAGFNVTVDAQDQTSQLMAALKFRNIFTSSSPASQSYSYGVSDLIIGLGDCQDWGPMEVLLGPPTADVEVTWTRSAGATNFSNVDEIPFTGDTDYNSSIIIGQHDIFDYQDPTHVPEFILAVSLLTIGRKEDSATREIANVLRVSGVDYYGDNLALMETYSQLWSHWLLNPNTGLEWLPAEYNAARGGYEYRV